MKKKSHKLIQILMTITLFIFIGCATTKESPSLSLQWKNNKAQIINDKGSLIGSDFDIPASLKPRVAFWMDIYGLYSSHHKVIHDSTYPWIVYEVINIQGLSQPERHIANRLKYFRKTVKSAAYKTKNLSDGEKRIQHIFKNFPKYLKKAHRNIRYQTGQRDQMRAGIQRSMPYLPHMEEIFQERGLPVELTRLPFVESSFNWKAHSKVGARGIWQFMRSTGKKFMKINRYVDERISPLKSTHAAAKLLKQNHKILYKEWPLALTAYNHGPGGVRKAVRKTGTKDMGIIANTYKSRRFSFASANFYSSFLAALYVEKYKDIVFKDIQYKKSPQLLISKTKRRVKVKKLIRKTELSRDEFLVWNPDMKRALQKNYRLPKNYTYYTPVEPKSLAYKGSISE